MVHISVDHIADAPEPVTIDHAIAVCMAGKLRALTREANTGSAGEALHYRDIANTLSAVINLLEGDEQALLEMLRPEGSKKPA